MTDQTARKLSAADVQAIFDRSPFIGWLGLKVVSIDHERQEIAITMAMRPEFERRPGTRQFHGGALAGFIHVTRDFALRMTVRGGGANLNFPTAFLRPAGVGALLAAVPPAPPARGHT